VADRRCHAGLQGQTPLLIIGTANQFGANADTFLTAVAICASCAFLTPIGHQNNTLILGPGARGAIGYLRDRIVFGGLLDMYSEFPAVRLVMFVNGSRRLR